jgi:hypothetical protein
MSVETIVVNFVAGPCAGKTTITAALFLELKLRGVNVEYVQEYAKHLVWTKDFKKLNNQYLVTDKQYNLLKAINGKVDVIITDGSLLHGLYYNKYNKDNTSNVRKTEDHIFECYDQFNNLTFILDRGDIEYRQEGRLESEKEAKEVDEFLKKTLKDCSIPFEVIKSDVSIQNIDKIISMIDLKK